MTEDELVEALALRFAQIVKPIDGIAGLADYEAACDLARARETLRHMRWQLVGAAEATRQIGPEAKEVPRLYWEQWARIIETGPLTLAPPDWQP